LLAKQRRPVTVVAPSHSAGRRWPDNDGESMSEQFTSGERLKLVADAIDQWLSLSHCPEWLWRYQVSWVDPRQIIGAHEWNQEMADWTVSSAETAEAEAEECRHRWDAYYDRAVAVEKTLAEHGEAVAVWLDRQRIPGAGAMALFLEYRQPEYAAGLPKVLTLAKVRAQALQQTEDTGQQLADSQELGDQDESSSTSADRMPCDEAAARLETIRLQGERWTSCDKMAERIQCSSSTVHKALQMKDELKTWATRTRTTPKAQSLTPYKKGEGHIDIAAKRTAQSREPDPAEEIVRRETEDITIRKYLERDDLKPEERAFFNALSREDQLDFLDDPDKHQRILGRKP
jgi:hypothetical protein